MAAFCHLHTYRHNNVLTLPSFHPLERSQHTILSSRPGPAVYKPSFIFRHPQIMLNVTGSTNGPSLQAGRRDRSSAATKFMPGKELGQTRSTSTHLRHSRNKKQDPSPELSPTNASTFLFMPGEEKCTLHPTKLLLGNGSNPAALPKDD